MEKRRVRRRRRRRRKRKVDSCRNKERRLALVWVCRRWELRSCWVKVSWMTDWSRDWHGSFKRREWWVRKWFCRWPVMTMDRLIFLFRLYLCIWVQGRERAKVEFLVLFYSAEICIIITQFWVFFLPNKSRFFNLMVYSYSSENLLFYPSKSSNCLSLTLFIKTFCCCLINLTLLKKYKLDFIPRTQFPIKWVPWSMYHI